MLPVAILTLTSCNVAHTQLGDNFYPNVAVSYNNSAISTSGATVISGSSVSLKLDLRDANFNPFVSTLLQVSFQAMGGTSTGTLGAVTNNGDGTYSVSFTGISAGTATTIHAFVNGNEIQSTLPTVTVTSGNYSLSNSLLAISSATVNSGSSITATLTSMDNSNNQLSSGGLTVVFSNSGGTSTGTWSATTDHNDGTYTATFTGVTGGTATTVSASIQGNPITSSLPTVTVTGGSASSLVFSTLPSNSGNTDTALTQQPIVTAKDSNGNPAVTYTSPITLTPYSSTDCSGSSVAGGLTATTNPVTASSGIASFAGVTVLKTNVQSIKASDGTFSVCSGAITISPGAASQLVFTTQPGGASAFSSLSPEPVVAIEDANGNVVNSSSNVTISINSGTGALSGTATVPASSGIATFTNLSIDTAGVKTLLATKGGITAVSNSFTIASSAPSVPGSLAASGGISNVGLNWAASSGSGTITYNILRSTTSGSGFSPLATGVSATTYTDLTALNGTTYYYVVQATSSGGTSANSSEVSARPISSFTISSVSVNGGSALQVSWGAATGASAYTLKYGTSTGSYGTTVSTSATSPTTVSSLTPGTTYYFMVVATNAVGSGTSVNATAESTGVPMATFTISAVTEPTSAQASVAFGASAGSTSYTVKYGTSSGTYGSTFSTSATSPTTVTGLTNGTPYYFMVYAVNASGSLPATSEGTLTPIAVPSAPTALAATGGTSNVGLTWTAASGSGTITYNILRSTTSGSGYSSLATGVSATSYSDLTALNGTTYYYVVTATNTGGTSANSSEVSARPISSFTISAVTVNGGSALQVSWGAATGASAYTLKYGTATGVYGTTVSTSATSPTNVSSLTPGTTYYFMVVATNAVGSGTNVNATSESSGVPLSVFTISSVTEPTSAQASVTFGASAGSTSYTVKYGTSTGVYGSTFSTSATSPTTVTGLTNGTPYYFMVYAVNGSGFLAATTEGTLTPIAAPSTPTSLTGVGTHSNSALSWTASSGSGTITYNIYRTLTSGSGYTKIASAVAATNYNDTSAADGTLYYYVVTAQNVGGETAYSNEIDVETINNFSLSSATSGASEIDLTWGSATGATQYDIHYGTATGTYTNSVLNQTSPKSVVGFTPGTQYYFSVTATNVHHGVVVASNELSAIPMSSFTISSITQTGTGQIQVPWSTSTGSTSYDLKYGSSSGTYTTTLTNQTSPVTIGSLTNGNSYYFMVVAKNASGSINATTEQSITLLTAPTAPTSVAAIAGTSNATLTWVASTGSGTITYNVLRSTTSGSGYVTVASGLSAGTLTYNDTGLTNGTTYYYVIQAQNVGGAVNSSEVATEPIAAFTITSVSATSTQASLAWGAATGATTYILNYGTSTGSYPTSGGTTSSTSATIAGINSPVKYYFMVTATNTHGGSVQASSEASATSVNPFSLTSVTQTGGGQVALAWGASGGATNYNIKYGTATGVYGTTLTNQTSPATITGLTPGTQYFFMVTATNTNNGSVNGSPELNITPFDVPTVPTSLSGIATSGQVALTWTGSTGGGTVTYNVLRSTTNGSGYASVASGVSATSYTDSTVANGTVYYYVVESSNIAGNSANSNQITASPIAVPGVPTSLSATGGASNVGLSWTASTGSGTITYNILRSTTSGSGYSSIATGVSATTYSDLTALNGTTYYYVVSATNSGGTSATSGEVSARSISAFTISAVSVNAGSALQVSWGAATGAAAYTLKYGTATGAYGTTVSTSATSPTTVSSLTPGTTYYFMVTANNAVGSGATVNASSEVTGVPLGTFTISSVTEPTSAQALVTYGASAGSSSYTVKYGTATGVYGTTFSTSATSPTTVTGLTNGTPYYFMVYAVNASGSLPATSEGTLTPIAAPSAPTALVATGGASNVGLTWTASSGSGTITYNILRSTTSGSGYSTLATGVSATSYSDLTALNGITYYYVVTATNVGGTSANSSEVSARPISAFTISAVTVNGGSALQVSWGAATGAAAYTLKYGTATGVYGTTVSTSATSPTTISSLTAGTTYYFMVVGTNAVGSGTSVNATSEMTGVPESTFSISSISQPTSGQATIAFGTSTGSTSYTVKYGTSSGSYPTTASTSATTPYTVTGLTNGTPYYFMVYAINASGTLAAPSEVTLTPIAAPGVPSALSATGGISNIGLSWTASSGSGTITYNILRSTTSGSGYTSLATGVSATTYSDLTALNGTTYYYVLTATNAGGTSANSSEVSARPISSFTISAVAANNTAGGSALQVSWGAATGAAAYTLKYGTTTGVYGTTVSTSATSPTTVSSLTPGTTYYFMVVATNAVGSGTNVNATAELTGVPMAAFTMTAATRATTSSAVSWASSAGSTSYTLKYGTATGVYGTTVSTSASSPTTVSSLTGGTTYYYRVTAVNGSGSLDSTAELSQTTLASFAQQWATVSANSSSYLVGTTIDFNGSTNSCELAPASQIDNSNASAGFAGGTFSGVAFNTLSDGTSTGLKMANNGGCDGTSAFCGGTLNSAWTPGYSSIVGYWKFDNNWNDSIGTNNFTTSGSPTFSSTNKVNGGYSASFSGSSQYATQSTNSTNQFGASDFTVSYWFYPLANCSGWVNEWGVGKWNTGGTPGSNEWLLGNCGGSGSTNNFTASIESGSTTYSVTSASNWTVNNWYHIAMTRVGTTLYLYVNGVSQGTVAVSTNAVNNNSRNLRIASSDANGVYTNAVFDELAIWNGRGLSATEVQTIYSTQVIGVTASHGGSFTSRVMDALSSQSWTSLAWTPTLPFFKALPDYSGGAVQNETSTNYSSLNTNTLMTGIAGLWHLDEASGTTGSGSVKDTSGNAKHATPSGVTLGASGKLGNAVTFAGSGSVSIAGGISSTALSAFTLSAWLKPTSAPATNWYYGLGSESYYRFILSNCAGGWNIGAVIATSNNGWYTTGTSVSGGPCIPYGTWGHAILTYSGSALRLYVNGSLVSTGAAISGTVNFSNQFDFSINNGVNVGPLNGSVDEVAIWNRALADGTNNGAATEIQQLYQRGASRLKFQVRSCSDSTCTTGSPSWQGPDGTSATYFSELDNMSTQAATPSGTVNATLPSMTLNTYTSPVGTNRYFQYRTIFESDSSTTTLMPELKSVTVGPNHYDSSAPTVISKTGVSYYSLSNAIQTLGTNGCSSGVLYNLGVGSVYSSATWYWWNGSAWAAVTIPGVAQANSAATIATNAATFGTQVGTGTIYFKAFLQSTGASACELKNLELDGLQ